MVATDEQTNERQQHATDSASNTGALNKMKATLSSSLLTVTDKGKWECAEECRGNGVGFFFWGVRYFFLSFFFLLFLSACEFMA